MVTELGFVSVLVAGLGALAGGLVLLAVRLLRGAAGPPRRDR
ncbi:small membrane protein MtfM [Pilimelia columellifera]